MRCSPAALLPLVLALTAPVARAQEPETSPPPLPDSVARHVVEVYNRPGTIRLTGDAHVPPGAAIDGTLAVLAGRLTIGGTVRGEVVVINGDLYLEAGAIVEREVVVVGGTIVGDRRALRAGGEEYAVSLSYRQEGTQLVRVTSASRPGGAPSARLGFGRDLGFGTGRFYVAAGGGYNRVEGLPLQFGPQLRLGETRPTVLSALAIYRTAAGLRVDPDRLGYVLSAEQYIDARRQTRVGARLYSEILPIEAAGLSTLENSLATFVLHRDFRDHYERTGWSAHARWTSADGAYAATAEYRDERHASAAPAHPWSLFGHQHAWRLQPAVAEGTLRALSGGLVWDTRNDPVHPVDGWLVRGELEQAIGGALFRPRPDSDARPAERLPRFRRGAIDARRYARLSPYASLAVRVATAGTLDAGELPPQRQHALGGEGTLPGFAHFAFDCGARDASLSPAGGAYHPFYGCDRMALVQLEYHANFPFARRLTERLEPLRGLAQSVRWVGFFDAGRAWTEPSARGERQGGVDFSADAGLGIRVGGFGLYLAVPVSGNGKDYNVFLRLGPRF